MIVSYFNERPVFTNVSFKRCRQAALKKRMTLLTPFLCAKLAMLLEILISLYMSRVKFSVSQLIVDKI